MPIPRSASMIPQRSRSASMSSLAQVDLSTLDAEVVLDYARKVMQLQPQPATSLEKLQMLFALSQKLMKWFLDDRTRCQMDFGQKCWSPVHSDTTGRTDAPIPPLHSQEIVPQSPGAQQSNEADKPSVASRILASAVAPVTVSDVKLADAPALIEDATDLEQSSPIRPAESATIPIYSNQKPELSVLQPVAENEPMVVSMQVSTAAEEQDVSLPQEAISLSPPTTDALQVYLQVQRSVICMQKYVRGYMARRRFFRALEELLQGRT